MSNLDKQKANKATVYTIVIVLLFAGFIVISAISPHIMMVVVFWILISCIVGILIYLLWKYIYDNLKNTKKQ